MPAPPKKPKPKLTVRIVECLEEVCSYANIGMELNSMEVGSDPKSEALADRGIEWLRKLIGWYDVGHHLKTGHWRGCLGPSNHTGKCPMAADQEKKPAPQPPVDPEFEAMVKEIQEEERAKLDQRLVTQRREALERYPAEDTED